MKRAVILAAGKGERLVNGFAFPKPLKRVAGTPLIVRVLRNLERAGIEEVGIVVGHLGDVLIESLGRHRFDLDLQFFWNDEVDKPNGTSLLKARAFITDATFLLMSDHLWSPDLIEAVGRYPSVRTNRFSAWTTTSTRVSISTMRRRCVWRVAE